MPPEPEERFADIQVGRVLRNWKVIGTVAQGGTSDVYRVRHGLVRRTAVMKVMRPAAFGAPSDAVIERFRIEAELSFAIRHPNVADFYDAWLLSDGTAILLLEDLEGFDLANAVLRVGRMSAGDAIYVAAEILRALVVMHERGVHRDVKPPNVFLCGRPRLDREGGVEKRRVRLLDFGLAKISGRAGPTREGMAVGSAEYMSPEQLSGAPVDGRSDLYAVGLIVFFMLTARTLFVPDPFHRPAPRVLAEKHLREVPDLATDLAGVPPDVRVFVSRLLEKDPARRPVDAAAALAIAMSLRDAHAASTQLFRAEVEDLETRIRALDRRFPPATQTPTTSEGGETLPDFETTMISAEVRQIGRKYVADLAREEAARAASAPSGGEAQPSTSVASSAVQPDASNGVVTPASVPGVTIRDAVPEASPATTHRIPVTMPLPDVESHAAQEPPNTARTPPADAALAAPIELTTDRLGPDRRGLPEWELRLVDCVRNVVARPRCFRSPALRFVANGAVVELAAEATSLGRDPASGLAIADPTLEPHHATIRRHPDGRLTIVPTDAIELRPSALRLDGSPVSLPLPVLHGAKLTLGRTELVAIDLAVWDPRRPDASRAPSRPIPPRAVVFDRASRCMVDISFLNRLVTLVGSSPACELCVPGIADITHAIWLRGDGLLEVLELDSSKLPYGETIVRASIVDDLAVFDLSPTRALVVSMDGLERLPEKEQTETPK